MTVTPGNLVWSPRCHSARGCGSGRGSGMGTTNDRFLHQRGAPRHKHGIAVRSWCPVSLWPGRDFLFVSLKQETHSASREV